MRQTTVLRKPELDSFLITAFSPELLDPDYLARSKLDLVTPRGVQLSTLFMEVQHSLNIQHQTIV